MPVPDTYRRFSSRDSDSYKFSTPTRSATRPGIIHTSSYSSKITTSTSSTLPPRSSFDRKLSIAESPPRLNRYLSPSNSRTIPFSYRSSSISYGGRGEREPSVSERIKSFEPPKKEFVSRFLKPRDSSLGESLKSSGSHLSNGSRERSGSREFGSRDVRGNIIARAASIGPSALINRVRNGSHHSEVNSISNISSESNSRAITPPISCENDNKLDGMSYGSMNGNGKKSQSLNGVKMITETDSNGNPVEEVMSSCRLNGGGSSIITLAKLDPPKTITHKINILDEKESSERGVRKSSLTKSESREKIRLSRHDNSIRVKDGEINSNEVVNNENSQINMSKYKRSESGSGNSSSVRKLPANEFPPTNSSERVSRKPESPSPDRRFKRGVRVSPSPIRTLNKNSSLDKKSPSPAPKSSSDNLKNSSKLEGDKIIVSEPPPPPPLPPFVKNDSKVTGREMSTKRSSNENKNSDGPSTSNGRSSESKPPPNSASSSDNETDSYNGSPTLGGRFRSSQNDKYGENSSSSSEKDSGLSGLRNIGNTCFMNSVLQCLSNTRPLLEYLNRKTYVSEINTSTSSMKGALIKSFAEVIHELWRDSKSVVDTTAFKDQIQRFAPRFIGYSQQDAQEFLRYLLEGLHEDINRVSSKPKPILTEIEDSLSDSQKSGESWKRYIRSDDSKIVDLFVGQLKSTLKCTSCGHCSTTFDPFWDLSLPIPSRTGQVRLSQCFELFTKEEILDGDEKPTCARCATRRKCTKSLSIQKFPRVLVIHLKRFSPTERYRGKLSTSVDFPVSGLDLSHFAANRSQASTYNLYGVSNHSGSTYSGHYIAYCRHPYNGDWHCYNDSRVSSISSLNVVSSDGYLLFYELSNSSNL